jgi:hypothetical protein
MGMHVRVDPADQESGQVKSEQLNPEQQERIRRRAHQIYEEHGREEGHALNHWLQAKAEVVNREASRRHEGKLRRQAELSSEKKPRQFLAGAS